MTLHAHRARRSTRDRIARRAIRALALAALVASACDRNVGTVDLYLLTPPGSDFYSADVIEVRVDVEGAGPWSQTIDLDAGSTPTFPDLPVGDGWTISVEAQSRTGAPFARGKSLPLVVRDGRNRVDLYVANVADFSSAVAPSDGVVGTPRGGHAAVPLSTGQVLLVGGVSRMDLDALTPEAPEPVLMDAVSAVEIFDPTSGRLVRAGTCTETPGEALCLTTPRLSAAVGRTPRGDVLVAGGGVPGIERMPASSLVFGSVAGEFPARFDPALAQTPGGALLLGGSQLGEFLDSVVVLRSDGASGQEYPLLQIPRAGATAASLGDVVFLFGGVNGDGLVADGELLDVSSTPPRTTIVPLPEDGAPPVTPRRGAAAAVVDDRLVMLIGGIALEDPDVPDRYAVSDEIDVYVPSTGLFCNVGSLPNPRYLHAVAVLPDFKVLVVGGIHVLRPPQALNEAYIINPRGILSRLDSGSCAELMAGYEEPATSPCEEPRIAPTATALVNGMVLVAGGFDSEGAALASYELYVP